MPVSDMPTLSLVIYIRRCKKYAQLIGVCAKMGVFL